MCKMDQLRHEPDGRVIFAEFESFRLLNTYVPNNGWKDEETAFQRRRKWDKRMLEFVLKTSDKPLIWCGDLNVSHQDLDVSHPEFFSAAKLNGYVPPNKEDCGQPGFTVSERKRFDSILKEGKLVDAYRYLHKDKDMERGFSWSGHPVGKYRGKRMRIDYFIVSEKLKERIVACEMHGRGIELEGFYGSDHCPVSLELSYASPISSGS
ncbi:UNVERIFIED_CONTAM: DNA-(apurinic or apyrimidinic site) lyase [Sesamum angustifolium]|uniref:DNA-(Apurinic or apyrimidinic site) lyase n=1 Tax=Sesamum angustifolium TaxID=2727405 RepID=A0AAW2KWC0_9LAMI